MAPRKKSLSEIRPPVDAQGRLKHAHRDHELTDTEPPDDFDFEQPVPDDRPWMTANQLVAYNLQRARRSRGWSQETLGSRLSGLTGRAWSKASVSAAESSWRGGRIRRFDANEILAFAQGLSLPVGYFLLPPDEDALQEAVVLLDVPEEVGVGSLHRQELLALVEDRDPPAEYVDRLTREFEQLGIEWTPGRTSEVRATIDAANFQRVLEALRQAGIVGPQEQGGKS